MRTPVFKTGAIAVLPALQNLLAEREGFEPSIAVAHYAGLANLCLQPLGHLSELSDRYKAKIQKNVPRSKESQVETFN